MYTFFLHFQTIIDKGNTSNELILTLVQLCLSKG